MKWEYDEFKSRKGNIVRIMDLEEYFRSLPADEKTDLKEHKEYEITCPYCSGDAYLVDPSYHHQRYWKHKLYLEKDFSFGFCYRCNSAYYTNNMDVHYHIPSIMKEYGVPSIKDISFQMNDPKYTMEYFKGLPEEMPDHLIDKLYNRNPYIMNWYEKLGFRPCQSHHEDKEFDAIAIPFYWKGEMIYYQIWQYPHSPKYYNPIIRNKPLYICGDIKSKAILVEGIFDALACLTLYPDKTPIAVLGSTVTLAQDLMLKSMFLDSIDIRMDDSVKSYKVYNRIKDSLEFTDLKVIDSDGTDPEEELNELIKRKFNE